ncbi:beta-class carbonic anhydrase [Euzebya rosea]|uniref:beta-class carbonic anhydrase n=1 Tax=Euzebya rosea TaxID=2052804 RepID=UPI000D3E5C4E|nr:carbonic anhydrase [Euzebya rosea]
MSLTSPSPDNQSAPVDLMARNADAPPLDPTLVAPPRLRLAVLTCMDTRIVPNQALGLAAGDAHVIRNGGARATDDAVRSLVLSTRLLGVRQVAVIHHTECGNAGTDEELQDKLRETGMVDVPEVLHANGPTSLADDVARLRTPGLLADGTTVEGYTYDVRTGRLIPLEDEG